MKKTIVSSMLVSFLTVLVLFLTLGAMAPITKNRFSDYLAIYRTGSNADLFIKNTRAGVVNFSQTEAAIGNVRPTGVTKTMVFDYSLQTFADMWVAAADSDLGVRLNGDAIIDSFSILSTFGAGDTVIVRIYKTTANATLISGPDTLVSGSAGYQTIDLTGVAAATRDFDISAGEYPAIRLDEQGTIEAASALLYLREYDATP